MLSINYKGEKLSPRYDSSPTNISSDNIIQNNLIQINKCLQSEGKPYADILNIYNLKIFI
jgi:hypothetical protein